MSIPVAMHLNLARDHSHRPFDSFVRPRPLAARRQSVGASRARRLTGVATAAVRVRWGTRAATGPESVELDAGAGGQPLVANALALMISTGAQAGLGLLFWILATRLFATRVVGIDAALITAMSTIALMGQLNLGQALLRFLPQLGPRSLRWVLRSYAVGILASASFAAAFVLMAPSISSQFDLLRRPAWAVGYVAAVAGWQVFLLEDSVLIGTHFAWWTVVENVAFSVLKIVCLVGAVQLGLRHGIFIAWVAPLVVLIPCVNILIFTRVLPAHVATTARVGDLLSSSRRRLLAFLSQDYLGVVISQATMTALPLIVVALVGARQNAYFYVAFTIATILDVLVYNAMTSLVVEAAHDEENLRELAWLAIRRLLVPLTAAAALLVALAPLLLRVYGPAYSHQGADVLRLLACALPFRAVTFLFDAVSRVPGKGGRILGTQLAGFVLFVPLTLVLASSHGLDGVGVAWLITAVVVSLAVTPLLIPVLRHPRDGGVVGVPPSPWIPVRNRATCPCSPPNVPRASPRWPSASSRRPPSCSRCPPACASARSWVSSRCLPEQRSS